MGLIGMMKEGKTKIGIIGAGGIAPAHIRALREHSELCEVVAICDINPDAVSRRAEEFNLIGYTNYRDMIEKESLDAVVIATPPATHTKIGIDVVNMGCNVLCEKPLAMSVREGRDIANVVEKKNVLFMVAFCHRFVPAIVKIKRSIEEGTFGPVASYRNVFCNNAGHRPTRGGNLMDNGSHSADIARYLLGDPIKVLSAQFRPKVVDDLDEVVDFTALLEGPNEEQVYLEAGGRHAGGRSIVEVCGPQTSALYDYANPKTLRWFDDKWEEIHIPDAGSRFVNQAKHFLRCLIDKEKCVTDVFEALKTLELLEQISISAGYKS